ncbi:MAG: peptidoglycan DD-metalloendopeptidase family protein [Nitrospirota bacterium]
MKNDPPRKFRLFVPFIAYLLVIHFSSPALLAEQPRDEYNRIQKDLRTQKKKLDTVRKVEQTVLEDLRKTAAELGAIEEQLTTQRRKIASLQYTIAKLQEEIKSDSAALQGHKGRLKKRLRTLLALNMDTDALLVLISGEDIAQTLRTMQYLRDIAAYDYALIRKYKEELRILAEKETGLRQLHVQLKGEEKKLSLLETSLKEKKRERETLLASVRKEKGLYENMIKELRESSNRLLRIIQEAERRERELSKKRKTKSKSGAKEEEPFEDSDFLRAKGKLPWPVAGSVMISYGSQVDPLFNLPVFRSGIHIKTTDSATVRAVHEGKVVFAEDFKGYGRLVIVSHGGGYHTLYGNLSKIFSRDGAIIKDNQSIGEVGESTVLGSPGLYFEIRYKGKPLDPQQWLRRS